MKRWKCPCFEFIVFIKIDVNISIIVLNEHSKCFKIISTGFPEAGWLKYLYDVS